MLTPADHVSTPHSFQLETRRYRDIIHNSSKSSFSLCVGITTLNANLATPRPQLAAACIFTATAAMYFAKLPILIFVMRTFGIHKWVRYTGLFLIVITALGFLAAAMWTGINCSPSLHTINAMFLFKCVDATYDTTVSRNSLSLAVDLVIFVLPLPLVVKLKLSRRKKIGVSLVFLTGSFGIVAAVVSLYYQTGQASKTSSSITLAMLTTIIECCTFLMVSCAPALRLFWSHYFGRSAFAHRLGLGASMTAGGTSSSAKRSQGLSGGSGRWNHSQTGAAGTGAAPIRVTTDHYIELHDASVPQSQAPVYTANVRGQWSQRHEWDTE